MEITMISRSEVDPYLLPPAGSPIGEAVHTQITPQLHAEATQLSDCVELLVFWDAELREQLELVYVEGAGGDQG